MKKILMDVNELRKRIFGTNFTLFGGQKANSKKKEKSVSEVMSILMIVSLFLTMIGIIFVLLEISFYKVVINPLLVRHYYIQIAQTAVTFGLFVFWAAAYKFECLEKYVGELEEMYADSLQGKVFQVQKEMKVSDKDFATAVQRDSGIVAELATALHTAEAELEKKKGFYNFLAKISFRQTE